MGKRVKGTLTVTTSDGHVYHANIVGNSCPCKPGLTIQAVSPELAFLNEHTPAQAQQLVGQEGWSYRFHYE